MDALKKAEEEKKRAAKRLQEVEMEARETTDENDNTNNEEAGILDNAEAEAEIAKEDENSVPELYTETAQFSLEPLSLVERADEIKELKAELDDVSDESTENESSATDTSEAFSEGLTLENTISRDADSQETFEETQKAIDLNDTTIIEGLSAESSSAPYDDTFHGVLFEDEEQESDIYEETLPGIPADQLAKDLGGGQFQPTPVAAKTVFSTGNRPSKKKGSFKWGVFVVLALLAVGSFAIFYYFTITPVSRNLPSPLIARGIESSGVAAPVKVLPPPVIEQPSDIATVAETGSDVTDVQTGFEAEEINQTSENETVSQQDGLTQSDEQTDMTTAAELEPQVEESEEVVAEEVSKSAEIDDVIDKEIKTEVPVATLPSNIQVDASLINITKSKKLEKDNAMLSQAFKAYQDGHYDAAKSIYESVLKSDSDNRDAHLGLAAIAIRENDRQSAYYHYVHLLELNPLDTLSMNALIGLSRSADPIKDESAIKLLIQRGGDFPYLYFSLGNLYAKQKRWADAQQAFFDAYRLDTTNPDYVLNLAVSLDQMGQYSTALDYYKTAIDLSQNSPSRFDPVPVNKRIIALSKLTEPEL